MLTVTAWQQVTQQRCGACGLCCFVADLDMDAVGTLQLRACHLHPYVGECVAGSHIHPVHSCIIFDNTPPATATLCQHLHAPPPPPACVQVEMTWKLHQKREVRCATLYTAIDYEAINAETCGTVATEWDNGEGVSKRMLI